MADERPPQASVMQTMTAAWTAQTIASITRLDVPDPFNPRSGESLIEGVAGSPC